MSRDTIVTDADRVRYSFDNLSTQKWLEGHSAGLDACVEWLNQEALKLFGQRKTNEALAMQKLADLMRDSLRPAMVERAKEHAKEYPYTL